MTDVAPQPDDSGAAPAADGTTTDSTPPVETPVAPESTVLTDGNGPEGAPETYADFDLPKDMEINSSLLEKAIPVFKEIGLTQIQSQQLVDVLSADLQAQAQANSDTYTQTRENWVKEAKGDTEIGGAAFDENVGKAKAALDRFGTPALLKVYDETGLGDHPEIIRSWARVGRLISEDQPGGTTAPKSPELTPEQIMYPNESATG